MVPRASLLISGLGYGATLSFVAVAAFSFLAGRLPTGWVSLTAGALAALLTALSLQSLRGHQEQLRRAQGQLELAQAQVAEQRLSVDSLADGLDVAIFICDGSNAIQYANRRATAMFDFHGPIGRSVLAVTFSPELEKLVTSASSTRSAEAIEVAFSYPEERIGLAKAWTPKDSPNRVFLSIIDITDLRRLMRVRQDFVANVSHELRTPLTVIRAMAETIGDDAESPSEQTRRYLGRIIEEVDRLSSITKDLLVLSAAESSQVEKQPCDLAETVERVVVELEPQAREKGLSIDYVGPESLMVQANSSQMSQVAINLIQNAINYTPAGSISVSLEVREPFVQLSVADTGIGISSENLSRIFERFYRVDKARSRSTGGTGLGLSIVRHIVESHGGKVSVQSSLNQGSTFTVTLPTGPSESGVSGDRSS